MPTERPTAAPWERPPKTGSSSLASEGSPRKPMPIEAIVIPIWQAESDSSISSSCSTTVSAPLSPSSASCSILPRLLRTSANSAATKKPLMATSRSRRTSSRTLIGLGPYWPGTSGEVVFGHSALVNIAFRTRGTPPRRCHIEPRMRIASLVPSATEMLFALGLGDSVVAVTHECDFPPQARSLPHLTRTVLGRGPQRRRDRYGGEGDGRRRPGAVRAGRGAARRARPRPDRHPGDLRRLRGLLRGRARGRGTAAEPATGPAAGPEHARRDARGRDPARRGDRSGVRGPPACGASWRAAWPRPRRRLRRQRCRG